MTKRKLIEFEDKDHPATVWVNERTEEARQVCLDCLLEDMPTQYAVAIRDGTLHFNSIRSYGWRWGDHPDEPPIPEEWHEAIATACEVSSAKLLGDKQVVSMRNTAPSAWNVDYVIKLYEVRMNQRNTTARWRLVDTKEVKGYARLVKMWRAPLDFTPPKHGWYDYVRRVGCGHGVADRYARRYKLPISYNYGLDKVYVHHGFERQLGDTDNARMI